MGCCATKASSVAAEQRENDEQRINGEQRINDEERIADERRLQEARDRQWQEIQAWKENEERKEQEAQLQIIERYRLLEERRIQQRQEDERRRADEERRRADAERREKEERIKTQQKLARLIKSFPDATPSRPSDWEGCGSSFSAHARIVLSDAFGRRGDITAYEIVFSEGMALFLLDGASGMFEVFTAQKFRTVKGYGFDPYKRAYIDDAHRSHNEKRLSRDFSSVLRCAIMTFAERTRIVTLLAFTNSSIADAADKSHTIAAAGAATPATFKRHTKAAAGAATLAPLKRHRVGARISPVSYASSHAPLAGAPDFESESHFESEGVFAKGVFAEVRDQSISSISSRVSVSVSTRKVDHATATATMPIPIPMLVSAPASAFASASARTTQVVGGIFGIMDEDQDCILCCDARREVTFDPCRHFVVCSSCDQKIRESHHPSCPICRAPLVSAAPSRRP